MDKTKLVVLIPLVLIAIVSLGGAYEQVHADGTITINVSNLSTQTVVGLIVVGIGAATLQAYQGWSASGEKFVPKAFVDRILAGALHSIWIAIGTAASYSTISPIVWVLTFGAAVGFTELTLKLASSIQQPDATTSSQETPSPDTPDTTAKPEA